jgi:uncharacterized membrane protein
MVYLLVLIAVAAMTAGQLLAKKGVETLGGFPEGLSELPQFFLRAGTNVYVIIALISIIVTAMAWLLALSKAELSHVYPLMALSYVLVAVFSFFVFREDVSLMRWAGIAVICIGVFVVARS